MKNLNLIEIAFFLKKIDIFEKQDLDELIAIADKINQDIYDINEPVFNIGNKATRMYFIASGKVDLFDEKGNKIKTLSKENFFGEESLFSDSLRAYKAVCTKKSLLLYLNKSHLFTIISNCPSINISLITKYTRNFSCRFKIL